jgi:2-iminobutanoate/2-iminopropanoate deaminase
MQLQKKAFASDKNPRPVGPYSPAIRIGPFVYVSGHLGQDPATGKLVEGGIEAETRRVLENAQNVLQAAGSSLNHVVRTTVYLTDLKDFPAMNKVYGEYFVDTPPARSTIPCPDLLLGARVEIDFIAYIPEG